MANLMLSVMGAVAGEMMPHFTLSGRGRIALRTFILGSAISMAVGCTSARMDAPVAAAPLALPAPAAEQRRMNVLFIVSDDLRVGGAYGSPEVLTPNIDRLEDRGVSFEQAYTQYPLCAPSRASFLTGLRPNTVRAYDLRTHVRSNVPDVVTLPQHFRKNGYFTARVGKIFHQGVPGHIGVDPDLHDDPASWDLAFNPSGADKVAEAEERIVNLTPRLPLGVAFAYLPEESEDPQTDELVATRTIQLINENKDRPFFIAAGFYRPHVPEVAPKEYFDLYPTINFKAEPTLEHLDDVLPAARGPAYNYTSRFAENLPPEQQKAFVRSYYAATSFMDAQVGRILEGLEKSGVADNTIVVFTSDHGFNLGEHGLWQKTMLWDQATRVPLIIYAPNAKGNGTASSKLVEMLDIYPTLADLAGLPVPKQVEGRSLQPLLVQPNAPEWNYPALSQIAGGQSVRFGDWRYTEWGEDGAKGVELYNLRADPGEYNNLAALPQYQRVIEQLKPMLPGDPPPSTGPKLPPEEP
jgi:iduronate 2-sulfatase